MADNIDKKEENNRDRKPVEVYAEKGETKAPDISRDDMKSLALAYAKFLADKDLKPGDATFIEPEELLAESAGKSAAGSGQAAAAPQTAAAEAPENEVQAAPQDPVKAAPQDEEAKRKEEEMKALASEYARFLREQGLKPGEEKKEEGKKTEEVPAAEPAKPEADPEQEQMKALAMEYAKLLREQGLKPGEEKKEEALPAAEPAKPAEEKKKTPAEEAAKQEEIRNKLEETTLKYKKESPGKKKAKASAGEKAKAKQEKKKQKEVQKQAKRKAKAKAAAEKKKVSGAADKPMFRISKLETFLAGALDAHDRIQDRQDESLGRAGRGFIKGAHDIAATYTNSRKQIGVGLLIVGVLAAGILILFDSFTVYEYAYNGKVLGYVNEQEEVTEVLDIAGEKLTQNNGGIAPVEFVANQNVTFNPVDGRGKSTDDMDTAVNKLIYMTDIETEAYAVYDGDRIVAIVKDQASAEKLLSDSLATLSRPDSGMDLVSAEFVNELSISPINVLLSSVQSNSKALSLMTKGGDMETLHIVEEGETLESIAGRFGVDPVNVTVYDAQSIRDSEEEEDEDEAADEEAGDTEESEDTEDTEEDSSDGENTEEENADEGSADEKSSSEKTSSDEESGAAVKETVTDVTDEEAGEVLQGDMVCIRSTVEPVAVEMVEEGKTKEIIEYETIKKKSDEYYQGDTHVEQEGRNGVQIFEGTLTKVAGEVTDRKEVSTSVIRDKQDKIILIGTKERPKTAPTGTYAMPLEYYTVTSEFGPRWGRMHSGIDLADPTGTPIHASDGGTIIRAEYFGGYGNCVEIDHENGRVTRYGHCSALLVNVGDKVYQGQEIALVGSTGNSTGPHLHFEVILDGVQHNPREFADF